MNQMKAVIVGCGNIFPMHALALSNMEGVFLTAVCDVEEERAATAAKAYGCNYYTDYAQMLHSEPCSVVHILTPHYLHAPMGLAAMRAKKHVLSEKPMSITFADGKALVQAAYENQVSYGVVFQNRYNAGSIFIKDTLESGALGRVKNARAIVTWHRTDDYYEQAAWRGTWEQEGGGVVINQAIHTLDLLRWLMNDNISFVDASIANRHHSTIEVEDAAEGIIGFANGATAAFWLNNYNGVDAPVEIVLYCEKGTARLTGADAVITYQDGTTKTCCENDKEHTTGAKEYWGSSHAKQICQFYEAIKAGTEPEITGKEVLQTQELVCAIYESGKTGKRIII